jgi:hypothetical protein
MKRAYSVSEEWMVSDCEESFSEDLGVDTVDYNDPPVTQIVRSTVEDPYYSEAGFNNHACDFYTFDPPLDAHRDARAEFVTDPYSVDYLTKYYYYYGLDDKGARVKYYGKVKDGKVDEEKKREAQHRDAALCLKYNLTKVVHRPPLFSPAGTFLRQAEDPSIWGAHTDEFYWVKYNEEDHSMDYFAWDDITSDDLLSCTTPF